MTTRIQQYHDAAHRLAFHVDHDIKTFGQLRELSLAALEAFRVERERFYRESDAALDAMKARND